MAPAAIRLKEAQNNRVEKEMARLQQGSLKGAVAGLSKQCSLLYRLSLSSSISPSPFSLLLDLRLDYPFKPPRIIFNPSIFHPNVHAATGELCMATLIPENWKSCSTIENAFYLFLWMLSWITVFASLVAVLNEPELDRPVNEEAASLWRSDKAALLKRIHSPLSKT